MGDTDFFLRAISGDVSRPSPFSRSGRQTISEATSLRHKIMESRGLLTLTPNEVIILRSMLESRRDDPFIDGEINLQELEKVGLTPNFTSPKVNRDRVSSIGDEGGDEGDEKRLYSPHEALIAPNCTPGTSSPIDSSLVQFEAPKAPTPQPAAPQPAAPTQPEGSTDDEIKRQAAAILNGVASSDVAPSAPVPPNQSVAESVVSTIKSVRRERRAQLSESPKRKIKAEVPDAIAAKIAALG